MQPGHIVVDKCEAIGAALREGSLRGRAILERCCRWGSPLPGAMGRPPFLQQHLLAGGKRAHRAC